jgi:hypothetical protein
MSSELAELSGPGRPSGGALFTIREQKYLLHHRSHCRYRRRPQSASRVLASRLDALLGA